MHRQIKAALLSVPNANHVSEIVCKHFGNNCLLVDGKYLHVKGFKEKIPLIWGIDEFSHDILVYQLAISENYEAYHALFSKLKAMQYPMQVLICDEHPSIVLAAKQVYPNTKVQICLNHFKETIRRKLAIRTSDQHKQFMSDIESLFKATRSKRFSYWAKRMLFRYGQKEIYRDIMFDINLKFAYLTTYYETKCPKTTNLIEAYNSHLEARIKSLRGFGSFVNAEMWLNAYIMNRRLSKFSGCRGKYRYLNGFAPLQLSAKEDAIKISLLKNVV